VTTDKDPGRELVPHETPPAAADRASMRISKAIIRLLSEYTGRGPRRARTTITGNLVVVLLEDTLTRGERSLVAAGEVDAVMTMRSSYQQAMKPEAIAMVEQHTGRRVIAFMSTNHPDPDYACELFVLDRDAQPYGDGTTADGDGRADPDGAA
jgi:uncharacterized protein YbcI